MIPIDTAYSKRLLIRVNLRVDEKVTQKDIVAANLYGGGIICDLLWRVRNNFPPDISVINGYSFGVVIKLWDWSKEQEFLREVVCHMSKAEQMKNLKTGYGIQRLLDEGHKILGNPINTFDTDYNLIAYTDAAVDDRFWNELITTRTFCIESQIFFMDECFTDVVANAKKLALMKSDKLKYDRILGHILNGNGVKVANILMLECNEAFTQDTVAAFEILVDLLTKEISNDAYYITYAETWQNTMIKRLIDYDLEEKKLYSPHVQNLYDGFKTNLYLAIVDIAKSGAAHSGQEYFVDLFRQKRKDFKYAVYNNYIIAIMSTDYKIFNIKRELNGLVEYFEQENLYVGISGCFDNLFELGKYYAEAVKALNGVNHNGSQHIFMYKKQTD